MTSDAAFGDKVRFQRPQLPSADAIERYLTTSREARWFSNNGPCARLLTRRIEEYVGQGVMAVPVANATLGLMVALEATAGDHGGRGRVLLPSFTYIASASAVRWAGFEPVFADVDETHWHMTPEAVDAALAADDGIVAVMACATFGTAPPVDVSAGWAEACRRRGAALVVDSAAGFGSVDVAGRRLGALGDAEVFSFHATKPFAVGEGGVVCTTDPAIAERLRSLIAFGLGAGREVVFPGGLNAKMSEPHAAIALAVMDGYAEILAARRERADRLRDRLADHATFQHGAETSTWQFVPALLNEATSRSAVLEHADGLGVELRTYHQPLHAMDAFAGARRAGDLPVTEQLGARIVSLPMANDLTDSDLGRIASVVEQVVCA